MTDEDDLSRVGISLPKNLLDEFDTILNARQYMSRSEGIRDAIRLYTISNQWLSDNHLRRRGVITLVYTDINNDLPAIIAAIRNQHQKSISVSLQAPISRSRRLEVLLVENNTALIRTLADRLTALKGMESVKVTTIPAGARPGEDRGGIGWDAGMHRAVADMPEHS